MLVLAGSMVDLPSQAVFFRVQTGTGWRPRARGAALLGIGARPAYRLPGCVVVALLVAMHVPLAVQLSRATADADLRSS